MYQLDDRRDRYGDAEQALEVPSENPGVEQRVAKVGGERLVQIPGERLGHRDGKNDGTSQDSDGEWVFLHGAPMFPKRQALVPDGLAPTAGGLCPPEIGTTPIGLQCYSRNPVLH